MTAQEVEHQARELGEERAELVAQMSDVQLRLVRLMDPARDAGVPIVRLAELVGITPVALYALARRRARRAGV